MTTKERALLGTGASNRADGQGTALRLWRMSVFRTVEIAALPAVGSYASRRFNLGPSVLGFGAKSSSILFMHGPIDETYCKTVVTG